MVVNKAPERPLPRRLVRTKFCKDSVNKVRYIVLYANGAFPTTVEQMNRFLATLGSGIGEET